MVFELVKLRYFHRKQPSLSETVDLAGKQLVPTDEQTNKKTKKKQKKQKKKNNQKNRHNNFASFYANDNHSTMLLILNFMTTLLINSFELYGKKIRHENRLSDSSVERMKQAYWASSTRRPCGSWENLAFPNFRVN